MTLNHFLREPIRAVCQKREIQWMPVWERASRLYPIGYEREKAIDAIVAAMTQKKHDDGYKNGYFARIPPNRAWLAIRKSGFVCRVFGVRIGVGYETYSGFAPPIFKYVSDVKANRLLYVGVFGVLVTVSISWKATKTK